MARIEALIPQAGLDKARQWFASKLPVRKSAPEAVANEWFVDEVFPPTYSDGALIPQPELNVASDWETIQEIYRRMSVQTRQILTSPTAKKVEDFTTKTVHALGEFYTVHSLQILKGLSEVDGYVKNKKKGLLESITARVQTWKEKAKVGFQALNEKTTSLMDEVVREPVVKILTWEQHRKPDNREKQPAYPEYTHAKGATAESSETVDHAISVNMTPTFDPSIQHTGEAELGPTREAEITISKRTLIERITQRSHEIELAGRVMVEKIKNKYYTYKWNRYAVWMNRSQEYRDAVRNAKIAIIFFPLVMGAALCASTPQFIAFIESLGNNPTP